MAIEYIIDGFYRSGSTAVWKIVKENNKKYSVFYEPFHPDLRLKLQEKSKDQLHNLELWNEYNFLKNDKEFKRTINKLKINSLYSKEFIFEYLSFYDKEKSILQTNRSSFNYKLIRKFYKKVKIIYLVRNPLSIALSLKKYHSKKNINTFWSKAYYLKNGYQFINSTFSIINMINVCYNKYDFPKSWGKSSYRKFVTEDIISLVAIAWLCHVYIAFKSNEIDKMIMYEKLVQSNLKLDYLIDDLRFDYRDMVSEVFIENYSTAKEIYKSFDLSEEYSYVFDVLFSET